MFPSLNYAGQSDSEVCLRGVDRGALLRPLVLRANPFADTNPADINQFIRFGRQCADFGRSAAFGEHASVHLSKRDPKRAHRFGRCAASAGGVFTKSECAVELHLHLTGAGIAAG